MACPLLLKAQVTKIASGSRLRGLGCPIPSVSGPWGHPRVTPTNTWLVIAPMRDRTTGPLWPVRGLGPG